MAVAAIVADRFMKDRREKFVFKDGPSCQNKSPTQCRLLFHESATV
jgi:hypothetical protein